MMFEIFQVFLLSSFSVLWDGFWRFDASLQDITPKRQKISLKSPRYAVQVCNETTYLVFLRQPHFSPHRILLGFHYHAEQ